MDYLKIKNKIEEEKDNKTVMDYEEFSNTIKDKLDEIADIRWAKINKIKESIKNNEYHINSRQIAERILAQLE